MRNDANTDHDPIESVSRPLSEWIVLRHLERDPTIEARYGPSARNMWRAEIQTRLAHLAQAVQVSRPELFLDSTRWAKIALASFDPARNDLRNSLECTAELLAEQLPTSVNQRPLAYVEQALAELEAMPSELPSHLGGETPLAAIARQFAVLVLEQRRDEAIDLLVYAFRDGASFESICLEVLQPTLAEVGRLWHMNELSVADEHYCTAVANGVVARLFADEKVRRRPAANGWTALITSVGGDMHELAPRIVSDFLELAGWRCIFLGANTPALCILDAVRDARIDLVAISVSTNMSVGAVRTAIALLRSEQGLDHLRIIVGGTPFTVVPDLWREVGADASAHTASDAVAVAERLMHSR